MLIRTSEKAVFLEKSPFSVFFLSSNCSLVKPLFFPLTGTCFDRCDGLLRVQVQIVSSVDKFFDKSNWCN